MTQLDIRKPVVCLSFTPNFKSLEFIVFDLRERQVIKTDHEAFSIEDPQIREIDEEAVRLKVMLKRFYDRNGLSVTTPTTLVLPSFFSRDMPKPSGVQDSEMGMYVLSQAEGYYVFKKMEPIVGYAALDKHSKVLYTAYPRASYLPLEQIFTDLKIPLIAMECHYTATIRGLMALGGFEQEIASDLKWAVIIVGPISTCMVMMEGEHVEKIQEIPLVLDTTTSEAVANQIKDDFNHFGQFQVVSKIILINNTTKLLDGTFLRVLDLNNLQVFYQNDKTIDSLGAEQGERACTLEALGACVGLTGSTIPILSLLQKNLFELSIIQRKKDFIGLLLIALAIILFIFYAIVITLMGFLQVQQDGAKAAVQKEIQDIQPPQEELNKLKTELFLQRSINYNIGFNNILIKTFQALPPDAWLKSVDLDSQADYRNYKVVIKGGSVTSEPLNTYLQELNTQLGGQVLTPIIEPQQNYQQQTYFNFELNNTPPVTP